MRCFPAFILMILLFIIICPADLSSQTRPGTLVVLGQVTDSSKEPLAGANVYVRGYMKGGTSTDIDGRFSLELPDTKKIIIEASFLGMKPYAVQYNGQKEILIVICLENKKII